MAALTGPRLTSARKRTLLNLPMAAAVIGYSGGIAVLDGSGNVKPGVAAAGLRGLGRFRDTFDNSLGVAGAISADVELGVFQFNNSAGVDQIAQAHIGRKCYVVDDQTVALTDGGAARSIAGEIADVDSGGVWVDFLAGSGRGKIYLTIRADDLVGADARVYGTAAPVAGYVTNVWASLERHAIAGADGSLTMKIGAAAITAGVIALPLAASAVGNVYSAQPTAANKVNPGDRVSVTVGGGNTDATAFAQITVEITQ